nr:MAG TPA: hypothetical protein [Caudoviricetes sp.]
MSAIFLFQIVYKNLIISSLHEYTELNKLFRNFPKT